MDPITAGALITGGSALVGGILSNNANAENTSAANAQSAENTRYTNEINRATAREQMAFQREMSNTSYQRGMRDMRAAGLNPMLAYSQGGASQPSGAGFSASAAPVQAAEYKDPFAPAISSAIQTYQTGNQIKQGRDQLAINKANSVAQTALQAAQTTQAIQSAKNAIIQGQILVNEAKKSKLEGDWYGSKTGSTLYQINKLNETVGGVLDSTNSAVQLINPFKQLRDLKKSMPGTGTLKDGTRFKLKTGETIP